MLLMVNRTFTWCYFFLHSPSLYCLLPLFHHIHFLNLFAKMPRCVLFMFNAFFCCSLLLVISGLLFSYWKYWISNFRNCLTVSVSCNLHLTGTIGHPMLQEQWKVFEKTVKNNNVKSCLWIGFISSKDIFGITHWPPLEMYLVYFIGEDMKAMTLKTKVHWQESDLFRINKSSMSQKKTALKERELSSKNSAFYTFSYKKHKSQRYIRH